MGAFNPYFSPTYQPNWNYPQYQPQQVQQPATSGIIWVSGLNEAQMYPVAPNNAVALWEQSGKTVFLKQADATGKPTMKIFDLVERTTSPSAASSGQGDNSTSYVTKEELGRIAGVLETFRGELETMKGDLYGVAGRKRTSKKGVEEDDA